jgi:hypothetical protein
MSMDLRTEQLTHRAAAKLVARIKQDTQDSHDLRDPVIETATVDTFGALWPSQSSVAIPLGSYYLPPSVAYDKPTLDSGDVVVIIWADTGQNRRPYVVLVANDLVPPAETGTWNADGSITTTRGITVPPDQVSRSFWHRSYTPAFTPPQQVVAVWTDKDAARVLRIVDVV